MKEHINFYEDLPEASKRLTGTVVKYDGDFYYVMLISNHKADGIFRIYLDPVNVMEHMSTTGIPYLGDGSASGEAMDKWMAERKETKILRKTMNSPLFERFKPFPLGMVNVDGFAVFTERSPTRHTQQGLTSQMVSGMRVGLIESKRWSIDPTNTSMYDMYMGRYPSYEECVGNLRNPEYKNLSVGFCRNMALLRGPCETLFLNYRGETIGLLTDKQGKIIRLSSTAKFLKELLEESGYFTSVTTE